ncbi:Tm-1-like ATP-binding domain-containing protein [Mesorhizobium sp. RMAD-H1]|uniref:Tm-1-like ATP-binding domain-containing protein n=1 Tax=Mesorhizobium sp. RMAD-H1 TaxID=2587065 RepID=UPI00162074DA|nr:Tm-1-like ATP-binding domain-containing protein [Mesorhizobium sp. RMAD-H1]MBB2971567.1 uncharacterized protein (UPF0261 family) [Mesorhizobium sp. RMAD-H1]
MEEAPKILVIGTGDTKADELEFIRESIERAGGRSLMLDISILGDPPYAPEYDKHSVAAAAGTTISAIIRSGDENSAMTLMSDGASRLARDLHERGEIDGMLAIGGTMGTDLALDVALQLPIGTPKFIVSTIAYSHLIPPERIAPDLMMILWAGGLYGLNATCRAVLSQACGAVVGAARMGLRLHNRRPAVAISSLGKSCLAYVAALSPELKKRGYEPVVFHTTGMGGRALEGLAAQKAFAAVMDFSLQEVANHLAGSVVTSGVDRMENAGHAGIPQIVAPGAIDMVDFPTWQATPSGYEERPYHAHNRLIASVTSDGETRRRIARTIGEKLAAAKGRTAFILPAGGVQQWDMAGEPLHEPEALNAFIDEMRGTIPANVEFHEIPDHINSAAFAAKALEIFDAWVAEGIIPPGNCVAEAAA